ncbi:MAG: hypothetical protein PVH88_11580 [Ignavibacteria bacterium]|jgi:hypothetical protein
MKSVVLISENNSIKEFFSKTLKSDVKIISEDSIQELIDYNNLFDTNSNFVIDITYMPPHLFSSLVSSIPIDLKLTVIASIPMQYLPEDYKEILTSRKICFYAYPINHAILNNIKYN